MRSVKLVPVSQAAVLTCEGSMPRRDAAGLLGMLSRLAGCLPTQHGRGFAARGRSWRRNLLRRPLPAEAEAEV